LKWTLHLALFQPEINQVSVNIGTYCLYSDTLNLCSSLRMRDIFLWDIVTCCSFLRWGVVSPPNNPQTAGPPFVGYPRLQINFAFRLSPVNLQILTASSSVSFSLLLEFQHENSVFISCNPVIATCSAHIYFHNTLNTPLKGKKKKEKAIRKVRLGYGIQGCIQKFPVLVGNKIYAYLWHRLLGSNTKDYSSKTH